MILMYYLAYIVNRSGLSKLCVLKIEKGDFYRNPLFATELILAHKKVMPSPLLFQGTA